MDAVLVEPWGLCPECFVQFSQSREFNDMLADKVSWQEAARRYLKASPVASA